MTLQKLLNNITSEDICIGVLKCREELVPLLEKNISIDLLVLIHNLSVAAPNDALAILRILKILRVTEARLETEELEGMLEKK